MAEPYLVFTLAATMASFGIGAGAAMRGTTEAPGHSLVVGLIGAALGLRRDDERLLALSEGLSCAVAMATRGAPLRDFHTVQSRKEKRGERPRTRKEALKSAEPYTTVTERDYLTDVMAIVAIARRGGPFSLTDIEAALKRPRFALYFGRKSCPLALPLAPSILEAESADLAMRDYRECESDRDKLFPARRREGEVIARDNLYPPETSGRRQRRRSLPASRSVWSYRLLDELVLAPTPGETT